MDKRELEERVGEKLTKQEQKILAYGYYAADRRSVRIQVRKRREEED